MRPVDPSKSDTVPHYLKCFPSLRVQGNLSKPNLLLRTPAAYHNCTVNKDAFTRDICSRIQVLSSVLLADTSGYM